MANEEGLSEFMKMVYKNGDVKDVQEAFKEFPVENEWHKGKISNVIAESGEKYVQYGIGDIVFVKEYKYSNGQDGYNHLFVIIDRNNLAIPIENFGMLISSQLDKLKYNSNILIEKDENNGLNRDSIVKTDVIYKILDNQIAFKIGSVDNEKIEEYKSIYIKLKSKNPAD